ncbi:MAG: hypothetical protein BM556_13360 [Bacteriovorax sp. MedPE-SWde]|nr:MAG: hypothetical protein BM556_13360 [Bacteriovorax sp. MedPE-SWde]
MTKFLLISILLQISSLQIRAECVTSFCSKNSSEVSKLSSEVSESLKFYAKSQLASIKDQSSKSIEDAVKYASLFRANISVSDIVRKSLCTPQYKHPEKRAKGKVSKRLYLKEKESLKCGFSKLISAGLKGDDEFEKAIRETNFDPCCIPKMTNISLSTSNKTINGFSVGYEGGAGAGPIGIDLGREVVFIQTSENEFDIAIVSYRGIETSVGLPAGVSVTQSVLTGKCSKIDDYLGFFSALDFAGYQVNTGIDKRTLDPRKEATGCNSEAVISGATTDLIGVAENEYSLSSSIVRVKGPRLKKLIAHFNKVNTQSRNRRANSKSKNGSLSGLIKDLKRRVVGKSNSSKTSSPQCSYSLDKQIKDFSIF